MIMKKNITYIMLCLLGIGLISCENGSFNSGPFDEQKCIVTGTLIARDKPIKPGSALVDPAVGLWIQATDKSYLINDVEGGSWPMEVTIGGITARAGDNVKVYGTSTSYLDYKKRTYHCITLDSIVVLTSREERMEVTEDFVVTGPLYINYEDDISITAKYQLKRSCYTYDTESRCIQVAGQEFCKHKNNIYDTVEAKGTLYYYCDDWGWMDYELDVQEIQLIDNP